MISVNTVNELSVFMHAALIFAAIRPPSTQAKSQLSRSGFSSLKLLMIAVKKNKNVSAHGDFLGKHIVKLWRESLGMT